MANEGIYVSELSTTRHAFLRYHFCRGNSNKRKSRLGVILRGSGSYIYLGKRLKVNEGDVVFIPERVFCYSEWRGDPEIEVVYLSCFLHYEGLVYEPQILAGGDGLKDAILQISALLSGEPPRVLEAYSRFYALLDRILSQMVPSDTVLERHLAAAIEYMTEHYNERFSISDLARHCCVSESTIYHLFRRELGETPIHFLNSIRINIAIEYLENSHYAVSTISTMVGFSSENHFRRLFLEHTGLTPLKYRKAH